ncbi:MFS transporter [Oceanobacillus senegalensis]|uniref:MFS transporter n=1 Tax=Oceanobacillus senegalensis TaxID=1936063 RepID=UPI0015C4C79D|nr:MFS transporter [Oceanobacillus senegalensis]
MKWVVLVMLFSISVLNYTDKSIYGLAAEPIMSGLDISYEQFGLPSSSFFFAYAIGSIIIGSLTYRFNTKYLLIMIALGWTVSLTGAYLVESFTGLIVIRTVLGFFEGGTYGLCVAHISKWFASESRGLAIALMTSGTTVGTYVFAPVLVILLANFGWKHSFATLGAASLVWAIIFLFLKERPKEPIVESVQDQPTKQNNAEFKDVIKIVLNPFILSVIAVGFVGMWIITWVVTWAPIYLTQIVGLESQNMGTVMAGIGISGIFVAIGIGKLADFLFKRKKSIDKSYTAVLISILLISAISFGMTTIFTTPILAVPLLGLGLVLNACLLPLFTTINSIIVPKNLIGTISGFTLAINALAAVIGPALTGYLVSNVGDSTRIGFNTGVLIISVLCALCGLMLLFTSKRKVLVSQPDAQTAATVDVE